MSAYRVLVDASTERLDSAVCAAALRRLPRRSFAAYAVTGDAIAVSLTGAPGDPARGRATLVEPHTAPASSATADRSRKSGSRAISRRTSPVPAAAGPKASFGFGWSTPPASIPQRSCRPITGRRTGARRHGMARQTDPVGRADRGYGGVSRNTARIGSELDAQDDIPHDASFSALPAAPPCSAPCRS